MHFHLPLILKTTSVPRGRKIKFEGKWERSWNLDFFLITHFENNRKKIIYISIVMEFEGQLAPWIYSLEMGMVVMFGHAFPFSIDIENYKCAMG
jgi:hypothetical protein